jgi:cellobiose phosphorylase
MRYGYFDDARREYVITRPDTPLPWINYLGSEEYFGIISNTAGGYSFYRDARLRRLTRYRYNNAPLDLGGRYVYLRDDDSGDYWSPSWQPTQRELEEYTCRHGLGYSIISSRYHGIRAETLYFVPAGETLEIWRVRVTNERADPARLSLFSSVEFCLWDAQDDATNFQRNYSVGEVEVEDGVIYHKTEYRERRDHFAFFACSEPLAGFDTQRDAFLGPYRGWDRPIAVERGASSNSIAHGWQPSGSHHVRLEMGPAETKEVLFVLGYAENARDAKFDPPGSQTIDKRLVRPTIARYLRSDVVAGAFEALQARWTDLLETFQARTGNEHVDRMVNIWNAYQCMVTFNMSRSASLFESGIGRGMGFRDTSQDLLGFVHMIPSRARERLLDLASTQLPTGGAYHQYQPLTKRGNNDIGSGFNDDPAWLVLAVAAYLKETGDVSILDEAVPYDNKPGTECPLYEHLQRSIGYTLERRGPHGLPLIGRADWNDCLNLNCFSETPGESFQTTENRSGGVAESVFIAGLFVLAADELAEIATLRDDDIETARCISAAAEMRDVVAHHGWDGAWFRRAYDFYGRPVGSADNEEGQIFIEPQGMCILAGIGLDDGRARLALDSVRERLATPHGIVVHQPAFTRYHLHLGEISTYPGGYKENAGVFCHTNPWVMIAETMVGNGDGALDYYLRINPSAREDLSEIHRGEPYVYAQMIAGKDAATPGEAKNTWLTGTAAWNYAAISQWILGIRPEHHGLRIDPCVPAAWGDFSATRRFRGATYQVTVRKAPGTSGRVTRLRVDGRTVDGNLAPLPASPGAVIAVEAFVEARP